VPIWKQTAIDDRDEIVEHIALDNFDAAIKLGALLMDKSMVLDQHPMMGRVGRIKGTRELVAHPNYILIYRVAGEVAEVLRVKHAAQQYP
jgi:toxin ParE1/3/4